MDQLLIFVGLIAVCGLALFLINIFKKKEVDIVEQECEEIHTSCDGNNCSCRCHDDTKECEENCECTCHSVDIEEQDNSPNVTDEILGVDEETSEDIEKEEIFVETSLENISEGNKTETLVEANDFSELEALPDSDLEEVEDPQDEDTSIKYDNAVTESILSDVDNYDELIERLQVLTRDELVSVLKSKCDSEGIPTTGLYNLNKEELKSNIENFYITRAKILEKCKVSDLSGVSRLKKTEIIEKFLLESKKKKRKASSV